MLFTSAIFLCLFLPLLLMLWHFLARQTTKTLPWLLFVASLGVLGSYHIYLLALVIVWLGVNFAITRGMYLDAHKLPPFLQAILTAKNLLALGLLFNASLLILLPQSPYTQEYFSPWAQPFAALNLSKGFMPPLLASLAFMQCAHLVQCYRNTHTRKRNTALRFTPFTLSMAGLPHTLGATLVQPKQINKQWQELKDISSSHAARGLSLFVLGMSKIFLFAHMLSFIVAPIFSAAEQLLPLTFAEAWLGIFSYTLLLYFSLSGMAHMAQGLGYILGIHLPHMFNAPLKAYSILEFWRRWNIPLADWIRDTVYKPLGGKEHGALRQHAHLYLGMLLGALWYGLSLPILCWGLMQATMLSLNQGFRHLCQGSHIHIQHPYILLVLRSVGISLAFALTFLCINMSFVFLASKNLTTAMHIFMAMMSMDGIFSFTHGYITTGFALITLSVSLILVWFFPTSQDFLLTESQDLLAWRSHKIWAWFLAILAFLAIIMHIVMPVMGQ